MAESKIINVKFSVIYETIYPKYFYSVEDVSSRPPLYYLQLVQLEEKAEEALREQPGSIIFQQKYEKYVELRKGLEERYRKYIPQAAENLLNFFQKELLSFNPQAIVRAPTNKRHLQQEVFDKFHKTLPDLSGYFKEGKGKEKVELTEDISDILADKERILIVDDVYATGLTVMSMISKLGQQKFFVVVCPLLVEQENIVVDKCIRDNVNRAMGKK